jgi:hypothetical protein
MFPMRLSLIVFAILTLSIALVLISFLSCKKSSENNPGNGGDETPAGGAILVTDTSRYIGVNYNESLNEIRSGELSRSKTKWVRGFIDVFYHYDNDNLSTSPRITEYLKLKDQGCKTCLNLKYNFQTRPYPALNSADWNKYIIYIDQVLDRVIQKTDVIVVGNEPFIESPANTWDEPLNSFYQALATRVNNYLIAHGIKRPVLLGSFDNMYQNNRQSNAGIIKLLAWCKATSWIAGIDLHIHHNNNPEITSAMDFVKDRIRADQKIIITEYSLMKWWRENLTTDITSEFIAAANANSNDNIFPPPAGIIKCWQYIDYALKNPRKKEEWNAFNKYTPWLEVRKGYLCNSFKIFKSYPAFWFATYAVRQSYPLNADFTSTTDPWVLNALFTARSVELLPNGEAESRYFYFDQFVNINSGILSCN